MTDVVDIRTPTKTTLLMLSLSVHEWLKHKNVVDGDLRAVVKAMNGCLIECGSQPLRVVCLESPLEKEFWEYWDTHHGYELVPQYEVLNGRYRLDFAHLGTMTAIELDGITYHGDDESFLRDRRRDRELQRIGWSVLRFTGDEVREGVDAVAAEVEKFIESRIG